MHVIWSPLSLMDRDVPFPPQVWEVFGHYFSKYSFYPPFPFSSFPHIVILHVLVHLIAFFKPLRLSFLLFFLFVCLFLFLWLENANPLSSSLFLHYPASSSLLLKPSIEFLVIVFFSSRISVDPFYNFCLLILQVFFSFCLCIALMMSFSCLCSLIT